jgi:hypothetical protein
MPSIPVPRKMRLEGSGTLVIAGVYVPDTVVVTPPFVLLKLQVKGDSVTVMLKVCVLPFLRKLPVIIPVRPPVAGLNRIPDRLSVKPELQVRHPPFTLIVEKLVIVNKPIALAAPRLKVAVPGGPTGLVWVKETVNCSPMLKLLASARGVAANKTTNRTKLIVIQIVTEGFAERSRDMSSTPFAFLVCIQGSTSCAKNVLTVCDFDHTDSKRYDDEPCLADSCTGVVAPVPQTLVNCTKCAEECIRRATVCLKIAPKRLRDGNYRLINPRRR